jgi:spore coat protein U-like protein
MKHIRHGNKPMPFRHHALFSPVLATLLKISLCALLWWAAAPAKAQSCWVTEQPTIAFGEVGTAGKDTFDNLTFRCQRNAFEFTAFRVCLSLPEGSPIPGINPRYMTNNNNAQMAYNLYSDPARTQIIGPYGSPYPAYSTTLTLSALFVYEGNGTMPVYARAPAGQSLPSTYAYQSQLNGGQLRYSYNTGLLSTPSAPTVAQCLSGSGATGSGIVSGIYTGVTATFANTCRITTASDLDFGAVTGLPGNGDQTSTIGLQCPLGTTWRVGLNNGVNANGNIRRMAGPSGSFLTYELYRDSGHSQRWGNTLGTDTSGGTGTNATQSLTVYGRVPAQPTPVRGSFSDTVTVTLTY